MFRPPVVNVFPLRTITAMVGDVNIYMNDPDNLKIAEVEIMIAESSRYWL